MSKETKNPYKVITFTLLTLIVIVLLFVGLTWYGDQRFESGVQAGQAATINSVVGSVVQNGGVEIFVGNQTIVLVPAQEVGAGQAALFNQIIAQVTQNGFIVLDNGDTTIRLVEEN